MATFLYKAASADGQIIEATLEADTEATVRSQLEQRGLLIFDVQSKAGQSGALGNVLSRGRLSLREFMVFNQQLMALIKAGLPVLKAFDVLAERASQPQFRQTLLTIRNDIRGGASISDAMAAHPRFFPDLYRASLRAGEQTGNLVEMLRRYIVYIKQLIAIREKVTKAMSYPIFLAVAGGAVVLFLLIYVMPTFSEIYSQNKSSLPLPTKLLMGVVDGIRAAWLWILMAVIGAAAAIYQALRTAAGRALFARVSLKLPVLGDVFLKSEVVRFARTLSTTLAGGIPMLTALQTTAGAMTNPVLQASLLAATDRVRDGETLAGALKDQGFMPRMSLEMIEVGETTGSLEAMLNDVAEFHEGELDLKLSQLTTWIEPIMLVVMGFIVGGIVIAMYLPIFQIANTV